MHAHSNQNEPTLGNWILAVSIASGSLLVGVFVPMFLLITLGSLIWIAAMFNATANTQRQLHNQIHNAEQSNLESAQASSLLTSLIHAANIPMLCTDDSGIIHLINQRALDTLGITHAMIGRPFDEILTQPALNDLESTARTGEAGHARLTLAIMGEMRIFDVAADQIPFSQGVVLTFEDITELSRAMTLKADFVANASHELRTPIASIKGACETLAGPAKDDKHMSARLIEMITNNANRLELLAGDLLDLSRLESEDQPPNIESISLCSVFDKVIAELSPNAHRRSLTLITDIEDGLDELISDQSMLVLMLRNLVGNAIKFAHEDTTVRLVARRSIISLDRTAPIPNDLNRTMGVSIQIIDKGIGIPLTQQQRVFERFYQVDDARTGSGAKRGTGLGLAIVKHAARRLGGSVKLESVHQIGTTITIELPRSTHNAT